jgi:hypothetical protein
MLLTGLNACVAAFRESNLPQCKPMGFGVIDWITVIGFVGSAVTLLWKTGSLLYRLTHKQTSRPIRSFRQLRSKLRPLVEDNSRIFQAFGPNSGASSAASALRSDVSAWKKIRTKIAENNEQIANIIRTNWHLVPADSAPAFERWLSHIDAFNAHLEDSSVDYRDHQFPSEVLTIIG